MNLYPFELEVNLLQIVILVIMPIWSLFRQRGGQSVAYRFFMWGMISHLLTNIYWTVSLVLDHDSGNVLKASDTAAIAFFLLWTSMFQAKCKPGAGLKGLFRLFPASAVVFSVWNYVWWNLWNLNLIIDTIWLVCIGLLLYYIFYSLDVGGVLSTKHRISWFFLFAVLFVFEIPMYLTESTNPAYILSDWICAGAWTLMIALFAVSAFLEKTRRTSWLFAAMLLSLFAQYLTDGIRYSFFMFLESIMLALLLVFFREEDLGNER